MKKHKVSILMTVYNHQRYVSKSIKSILNQNYKNFELIVINNGSSDNSLDKIKKFKDKRIKIFNLGKNIGRTNCLNFGLKKCNGKYIAIQDSDDISKKNRIVTQVNYLDKNKKITLVGSNYSIIDRKGKIIGFENLKINLTANPKIILFKNIIGHSTVMYRKNVIKFTKGYPSNFVYAQDYAFYLKIISKFKISLLQDNLVSLRLNHSESESYRLKNSLKIQKEEMRLIYWALNNIKTDFVDKIKILKKIVILFIKMILISLKLF